jgi:hypothetical protein
VSCLTGLRRAVRLHSARLRFTPAAFGFGFLLLAGASAAAATMGGSADVLTAMRAASEEDRAASFATFLRRHGQTCSPSSTYLNGPVRHRLAEGDLWSVQCREGASFAVLITPGDQATSWYLPCHELAARTEHRCFTTSPTNGSRGASR